MLFSKIIKKKFDAVLGRYDGTDACYYFSPKDFPEIKTEKYDIKGDRDVNLSGAFYYYDEMRTDTLVIFDHGIGAGHLAYFKEIECLAKKGYTVYSYDHTGCVDSEGSGILGFGQGVNDLDKVLTCLKADERFKNADFKLVGHSWGAYSSMNACALHPEVSCVVSLAGFLSAKFLVEQYIPKMFLKYSPEVMDRERQNNPDYADMDARDSLKKSKAKFLHIQSTDDKKVKFELSTPLLKEALNGRENTEFIVVENRNHEPQHTDKAVEIYADMMGKLETLTKKKKLETKEQREAFRKSQDWDGMTQQDPQIWEKIFEFLEK